VGEKEEGVSYSRFMRRKRLTLKRGERTALPRTSTSQTTREFEKRRVERERESSRKKVNRFLFLLCVFQEKKGMRTQWKRRTKKNRANRITHLGLSQSPRQTKKKDWSIDDVSIRFSFLCMCVCFYVVIFSDIFFFKALRYESYWYVDL